MTDGRGARWPTNRLARQVRGGARPPIRSWAARRARSFSAAMASSAATIGLALSLGPAGPAARSTGAVPVVLGANIGTCATALAASLRATADARRVAVAHIAFKVLGRRARLPVHRTRSTAAGRPPRPATPARQIANAHTLLQRGDQRRSFLPVRAAGQRG